MASSLPLEVIMLIAGHSGGQKEKLTPFTLVNKSWQAAFEKELYSSLVVLSPSRTRSIEVRPGGVHEKLGLPLAKLIEITSGPQHWRQNRRRFVRHILYRVAVPHWLNEAREKLDGYTYDNVLRRENNLAFSVDRNITLAIALQAESVITDEDYGEPESTVMTGVDDEIAPYCAAFPPNFSLPRAACITSLAFPDIETSGMVAAGYGESPWEQACPENRISLPAVLTIASVCGAIVKILLHCEDRIPLEERIMRREHRDATIEGLLRLPSSIRDLELCWYSQNEFDIDKPRTMIGPVRTDALCVALHKVSLQLQYMSIGELEVFPELFCPDGPKSSAQGNWPYLEQLQIWGIFDNSPQGAISRYADGVSPDKILVRRYLDDLFTSVGHAAQRMPRIQHLEIEFPSIHDQLRVKYLNGRWKLSIWAADQWEPSPRLLEAWKIPPCGLLPDKGLGWWKFVYSSWPPL
ncbi:hypothetical protein E4T42_02948 [Aureobasidium subglaciale]|nr:hypothetical protein E4T42_02948 [Aureobasidium subglaciale]